VIIRQLYANNERAELRSSSGPGSDEGTGGARPEGRFVVRIDFREWTDAEHLRNTKFVALRDDKDPRKVVRET